MLKRNKGIRQPARFMTGVKSVVQLLRTRRWLEAIPGETSVGRVGYQVIGPVLTSEQCQTICIDADTALHAELPDPATGAFIVERRRQALASDGYDTCVYQLMNYDRIAPWIADVVAPLIRRITHDQMAIPLYPSNYSVQVDWPDSLTKRPYHTDGFEINFKLFIYLTDVDSLDNGPYTVVPGSHLVVFGKIANLVRNLILGRANLDDMQWRFRDRESVSFIEQAGTGILSCQSLVHKGWQDHVERKRYMLVVYLSRKPPRGPSGLGREWMVTEPISTRA